ncbi:MAG: hypothetical protein LBB81_01890 [Treponema sp.]|jgi:hypothetical protein|nr:hypothetical protein [Treponema sp.]
MFRNNENMFRYARAFLLFLLCCPLFSCGKEGLVNFPVPENASLYAKTRQAKDGILEFSKPKKHEYRLIPQSGNLKNCSVETGYYFSSPLSREEKDNYRIIFNIHDRSFELPLDISFLEFDADISGSTKMYYSIPVIDTSSLDFSISLEYKTNSVKKSTIVFKIDSINIRDQWFGCYEDGGIIHTTPFVYKTDNKTIIDVPSSFKQLQKNTRITASGGKRMMLESQNLKAEAISGANTILIPALFTSYTQKIILTAESSSSVTADFPQTEIFPQPVSADPALILEWPRNNWRNADYEVFRWDDFPSILIFDTADYGVQDKLFKRLAFFVEKTGFRGRLAGDDEIANLHGWNAHDYRAEDLARFFNEARKTNFQLLKEELELRDILIKENIIRENADGIRTGKGAIISISRESEDYLRYRFMVHEAVHGLFFIDEDFRSFSVQRWRQLKPDAKRFIISFFGFQQYDTNDEYLMINEFTAHVLQQPVSRAADYFGRLLPSRLESSWRRTSLPRKNEATGTWPELAGSFTAEASAFSSYLSQRWNLAAGRVWKLNIK